MLKIWFALFDLKKKKYKNKNHYFTRERTLLFSGAATQIHTTAPKKPKPTPQTRHKHCPPISDTTLIPLQMTSKHHKILNRIKKKGREKRKFGRRWRRIFSSLTPLLVFSSLTLESCGVARGFLGRQPEGEKVDLGFV